MTLMQRVSGIGGIFFRAHDPRALARWYAETLGIDAYSEDRDVTWWPGAGPTVFAPFPSDTEYFGSPDQQAMLNFRVDDLNAMLAQLRAAGASVDDRVEDMAGVGRFAWATDPEGNRFELWQPAPEALRPPG
jgi:predicted enzyme related to lactoylglutathione lyase